MLYDALRAAGVRFWPSDANFVLAASAIGARSSTGWPRAACTSATSRAIPAARLRSASRPAWSSTHRRASRARGGPVRRALIDRRRPRRRSDLADARRARTLRRLDRHPVPRSHARSWSRGTAASICECRRRATSTSISTTRSRTSASRSARRCRSALGTRRGINRAGYFVMPMDETLGVAAIDLGGRRTRSSTHAEGARRSAICRPSWSPTSSRASPRGARANVHVKVLYGRSSHHQIEALFKAFARALRVACSRDRRLAKHAAEHQGAAVIALIDYGAGNLTSVARGSPPRAPSSTPTARRRPRARRTASSCPASGTSRDGGLDEGVAAAIHPRAAVATACRCSASASGLQWLFEGSDEAPTCPGSARSRRCCARPAADAEGAARRLELARRSRAASRAARRHARRHAGLFTHSYAAPVTERHVADDDTATVRRRRRARHVCSACSSIRRSPATPACRSSRTSGARTSPDRTRNAVMLSKRIIACLDVRDGCVVKGVSSRACATPAIRPSSRDATTPRASTSSSSSTSPPRSRPARAGGDDPRVARELFIPLAVGGGIRD